MKGSLKTKMRFSGCLIAIGRRRGGKPGSVVDSHSSRPAVADRFEQPTRTLGGPRRCVLFGLAADGVWPAAPVASRAVRSYRTFSPLPVLPKQPSAVLLSVPLSVMLPCPAVSRHPALCSPDFPPRCRNSAAAVCPACARRIIQASGQPERRCGVVGKRSQYCQALPPCL